MQPNLNNKKKKRITLVDKNKLILTFMLMGSLTLSVPTIIDGVENVVNNISYDLDVAKYDEVLVTHYTNDREHTFVDVSSTVDNILNQNFNSREDFYHCLLNVGKNIIGNQTEVFNNIISELHLDKLAQNNSIYPTQKEFEIFLENYNLKPNGTIDFKAWTKYDKKIQELEHDLEELKGGKPL